jgi:ferredoxin
MNDLNVEHHERSEETSKQKGELTRRELLKKASPLGRVKMINRTCTACGLCAMECKTGALSLVYDEDEDTYRLFFTHHLCVACGRCVEICPENCLNVERTLDTSSLNQPAEILFEGEVVRCTKCGKPFASRAMIDSLMSKLGITRPSEASYMEICPDCKAGIRLSGAER